ncbi:hypothetical protein ACFUTX_15225 [Microbacterium sp. NPDC057407]|uniref:hypothetical protein n=1 Tax=Microbacterium sp. NPDC057407 TaxID=3346120 RepID=UPI0036715B1D
MADREITLSADEALVLFDMLRRWDDPRSGLPVDRAERAALWALSAALERVLTEPFDLNYVDIVAAAREKLGQP